MNITDKMKNKSQFAIAYFETQQGFNDAIQSLKSKIRLFWNGLWIRKDEFHSSLDMDGEAMMHMNGKQRDRYMKDLVRRRNIAHERDMKKNFK
jgi:hypothetical protein